MKLGDYLRPDQVVTDVEPGDVGDILRQLVEPLVDAGRIRDREGLIQALLDRETLQSTGIGSGVAVPHAICEELEDPRLVLGLCPEGADFHALDDLPVHLFLMLLSPPDETRLHIKLLARIARMVRHADFIDELLEADDRQRVVQIVEEHEGRHV